MPWVWQKKKKKREREIEHLTFAITWIDLGGIVLSETRERERKTNTIRYHLFVESKTKQTNTKQGVPFIAPRLTIPTRVHEDEGSIPGLAQ